jgi:hypothetical protein
MGNSAGTVSAPLPPSFIPLNKGVSRGIPWGTVTYREELFKERGAVWTHFALLS